MRHLGPDAVGLFATDGPGTSGSNGRLVTGERTATGGPVIVGDPHRHIEAPGVYQQIRLSCPEFDVIGLAVPPPAMCGMSRDARTASGWCRSVPRASRTHGTTTINSPCGSGEIWPPS